MNNIIPVNRTGNRHSIPDRNFACWCCYCFLHFINFITYIRIDIGEQRSECSPIEIYLHILRAIQWQTDSVKLMKRKLSLWRTPRFSVIFIHRCEWVLCVSRSKCIVFRTMFDWSVLFAFDAKNKNKNCIDAGSGHRKHRCDAFRFCLRRRKTVHLSCSYRSVHCLLTFPRHTQSRTRHPFVFDAKEYCHFPEIHRKMHRVLWNRIN